MKITIELGERDAERLRSLAKARGFSDLGKFAQGCLQHSMRVQERHREARHTTSADNIRRGLDEMRRHLDGK